MADSTEEPPAPPAPEVDNAAEESTRVGERNLELLRDQKKELVAQADLFRLQLDILKNIAGTYSEREQVEAKLVEYNVRLQELNRALGDEAESSSENISKNLKKQDKELKKQLIFQKKQKEAYRDIINLTEKLGEDNLSELTDLQRQTYVDYLKANEAIAERIEELQNELQIRTRIANIEKESIKTEKARIKQQLESRVPPLQAFARFRKLQQAEGTGSAAKQMGSLAGFQALEGLMNGISGLTSALGPLTSVAGIVQKLVEGFIAFREDQVDLNRVILGNREAGKIYDEMASDIGYATELSVEHGLALTDVKETMINMYKENSAFQHLIETSSRENIKDLTHLATTFKNLELSAADVAKVMDITTRNMQMSATETATFLEDVKDRASKAGQTVSQYVSNFTSQLPQLRIYGDNSVKIFNRINKQAQNTGASIAGIMNIGKQFETYESAATTATKLNMILGSNFDALKAISASPDEMVDMIRGQISPSDLESMGHLQRKYLSGVLGIEYDQLERIVQGKDIEKDKSPAAMMGNIVKDTDRIGNLLENIARSVGAMAMGFLESAIFGDPEAAAKLKRDQSFDVLKSSKSVDENTLSKLMDISLLGTSGKNLYEQTQIYRQLSKEIKDSMLQEAKKSSPDATAQQIKALESKYDKTIEMFLTSQGTSEKASNELIELLKGGLKVHGNVNANIQEG